jgi:O-antigen/teichoic acid export membrane protein
VLIDNLTLLVILACIFSLFLALGGNELLAMRFDNPDLAQTLRWMIPYPLFVPVALWLAFSSVPGKWTLPDPGTMKQMLKFSVPLGLATMFGTMSLQLDKVIVSALTSPEEFAVYSNGAVEIPLIGIITGAVTVVVLADMRKSVADGNFQEAIRLFRLTAEKTSYILFPAMVFLFISADSFIQTLFSDKYADSVIPFRWYLLLLPVRTAAPAPVHHRFA